jgi:tRNA A37 methylthiotransferase MiaB
MRVAEILQSEKTQLLKDSRAAVPESAIAMTLIVGYPGENQEDFMIAERFCARNED